MKRFKVLVTTKENSNPMQVGSYYGSRKEAILVGKYFELFHDFRTDAVVEEKQCYCATTTATTENSL